jgi:hypothetical protein
VNARPPPGPGPSTHLVLRSSRRGRAGCPGVGFMVVSDHAEAVVRAPAGGRGRGAQDPPAGRGAAHPAGSDPAGEGRCVVPGRDGTPGAGHRWSAGKQPEGGARGATRPRAAHEWCSEAALTPHPGVAGGRPPLRGAQESLEHVEDCRSPKTTSLAQPSADQLLVSERNGGVLHRWGGVVVAATRSDGARKCVRIRAPLAWREQSAPTNCPTSIMGHI